MLGIVFKSDQLAKLRGSLGSQAWPWPGPHLCPLQVQTLVDLVVLQPMRPCLISCLLVVFFFLCAGQKSLCVGALSGFRGKSQGLPHLAFHHPGKENDLGSGVKVQGSRALQPPSAPSPLYPRAPPWALPPWVGELI